MNEDFDPKTGRDKVVRMTPKGLASVEGSTALILHTLREHGPLTLETLRNHCKDVFHWDNEWTELVARELKRLGLVELEESRSNFLAQPQTRESLYRTTLNALSGNLKLPKTSQ